MPGSLLIVGLGSPHGDDCVGWEAVYGAVPNRADVDVLLLREPTELLEHLGGRDRVWIVDACRSGGAAPGTIHRLTWPDETIIQRRGVSSHGISLVQVLQLAEKLGRLPEEVVLYLVEIDEAAPGEQLGEQVQRAISEVRQRVCSDLVSGLHFRLCSEP